MRIAVLSDTHMPSPNTRLRTVFENQLSRMDAVLHCGDFTGESVYSYLSRHSGFFAVRGNMDQGSWAADLPFKLVVRLGDWKIGLVHGFGLGDWRHFAGGVFGPELDLICFGHTHQRLWQQLPGKTAILNPGSFSLPRHDQAGYAVLRQEKGKPAAPLWEQLRV